MLSESLGKKNGKGWHRETKLNCAILLEVEYTKILHCALFVGWLAIRIRNQLSGRPLDGKKVGLPAGQGGTSQGRLCPAHYLYQFACEVMDFSIYHAASGRRGERIARGSPFISNPSRWPLDDELSNE
jgi:hypothetical protein